MVSHVTEFCRILLFGFSLLHLIQMYMHALAAMGTGTLLVYALAAHGQSILLSSLPSHALLCCSSLSARTCKHRRARMLRGLATDSTRPSARGHCLHCSPCLSFGLTPGCPYTLL